MNTAVIGASDKEDRYSYKALKLLQEHGHQVYAVHPRVKTIDGVSVYKELKDVTDPIDTLTMYVAADVSSGMAESILNAKPRRIIFNPGAENAELEAKAKAAGIMTLNACTLVMLNTGQF